MPGKRLTTKEAITLLQERAYAASGMTLYDVQAFYRAERERIKRFAEDHPDYLISREEMLQRNPSLAYIELDLPKRFDKPIPGLPYQHPYLYPWMEDVQRYHAEKLAGTQMPLPKLIVATAPTGRFNAIAIPDKEESGIVIEDGLLNVAINYSNTLSYFFYEKLRSGRFRELDMTEVETLASERKDLLVFLAETIWQYVINGYSYLPEPIGLKHIDDFSIRHVLSNDFLLFVLKHEGFHIEWWRKGQVLGKHILKNQHRQLWNFYHSHIAELFPEKLSAAGFKKVYYNHQEELLADLSAFRAVVKMGKVENTLSASVKGGLLFFLIAELIQHLLFHITDTDFAHKLHHLDGFTLSLTAILAGESHPYAFARKHHILHAIEKHYPEDLDTVREASAKMEFVANRIRELLDQKVVGSTVPLFPHPKWEFGKSILFR